MLPRIEGAFPILALALIVGQTRRHLSGLGGRKILPLRDYRCLTDAGARRTGATCFKNDPAGDHCEQNSRWGGVHDSHDNASQLKANSNYRWKCLAKVFGAA
jgi:hypothetical protein